jgi:hypothetical protein
MAEDRNLFPRANSDETGGNFLVRRTNEEAEALSVKALCPLQVSATSPSSVLKS